MTEIIAKKNWPELRKLACWEEDELDELLKRDTLEIKDAMNYLKRVSNTYLERRGKLLRNKQIKEAKAVHDELGQIYLKIADKLPEGKDKESLKYFVSYWARNGESDIFTEP